MEMMIGNRYRLALLLLGCLLCALPVVEAQISSSRLQGSAGVKGARGLRSGGLSTGRLQSGQLSTSGVSLRDVSVGLARNGLSPARVQGAASGIPASRMGELFFGVARELEWMEGGVTGTSVGYYMATLTDPAGRNYVDAKRRICAILLEDGLSHEQAVGLYNGGLETLRGLVQANLGITDEGLASGMRDLAEIKAAYHVRRESSAESSSTLPVE